MAVAAQRTELSSGWSFKQTDTGDEWLPVTKVPSVCHLDLIANKKIPDPFVGLNEIDVEWVGEKSWTYRTTFSAPQRADGTDVYLIFEGLDTIATVKLNDAVILQSDNMFLSHRVNVTKLIQEKNSLVIDFGSALLRGRALEKEHSEYRFIAHNGETGRLAVRKAQYHWGWDWGPVLMTAGPWRPVYLEVSSAYVDDVRINYTVTEDLSSAAGSVQVDHHGQVDEIRLSITHQGQEVFTTSTKVGAGGALNFELDDPKLWYPVGYGDAALYDFNIDLIRNGIVLDTMIKKTGLRRAELIQKEDAYGESFYFRINNIDVFAGGSCWIPADNFLPRLTKDKYRDWLNLMIEGNQIMTRVWGGGIYEDNAFYDICDELGILVWQDFMFACGSYPTWKSLRDSVEEEARQNVRRLRHHPSIVIYAGNNEDYQIQEQYKLEYDYENKDAESWLKTGFPARYYYEHLLGTVVADESPSVPYWPSSPFSKGKNSFDLTVGDVHQWNVWHGTQEKYQTFDRIGGRFNSEFGLEAFPNMRTIQSFVTKASEFYPQSHVMDFHNKADGHERRIATYVVENFRPPANLEAHIYLTQLMQSEALAYAYRGWRRQWGEERRCGGALVWQINDCWPCTSWAIVDYYLRKKPGFYTIARALRPVSVGVQREHHDWSVCHARPAKQSTFSVWVSSNKQQSIMGDVEIRFVSIATGEDIKPAIRKTGLTITPNGTTSAYTGTIDNLKEEPHVLSVRLFSGDEVIARDMDWPQPFKYLSFENRGVDIVAAGGRYTVTVKRPTKGLVLNEFDNQILSDNCIDLVPGDTQVIEAKGGFKEGNVPVFRYLGDQDV
ncbi:beta-mannosidase [Pochonia chlamydosporia 170]|uniref:Beta-mannosidase B n=1 Tax=Pochonia chlamydosporia 170 TaxID=1380566 RepID=A0A179FHT1_METCM|nr:beta-mannosidase [Pochonia chlamydosporia 170]OAQ65104.1 beta-mannosidase [Pochonia chlamydosporia 170]